MSDLKIEVLAGLNESKSISQINKDLKDVQSKLKGFELSEVKGLTTQMGKLKDGTEALRIKTVKLKDAMGNTASATLDAQGKIKKTSVTMKDLKNNTQEAKTSVMGLGAQTIEAAKKFAVWSGVTTIYFGAIRAVKQMVEEVKNLDDAMLELSKVTDLTNTQMKQFASEAADVGERINATAAQVVQASADFARMGFDPETSLQLAEDATVLTKIADGIDDVSEASTAMIAILKGFNLEAQDSAHIIDAINEVSNNFAIQTDQLADGLRRVGGTMAQSNTSLEETIGLLTSGQESLQNMEKVSSGLITISTRLRRVKEDTEDMNGLMVNVADAFDTYTDGAVKIEDSNGELRSTYDILLDLANVWDNLDDKSQAYLGFLTSGTRQTPVLNAVMSNLKTTTEATSTAIESAGSASEEFLKVQESLQGQLDKLSATWSRIATDFISSEFVGILLDLANAFSMVVEEVGLLTTAVGLLAGVMGVRGAFGVALTNATAGFAQYIWGATASTVATTALATAMSFIAPLALAGGVTALATAWWRHNEAVKDAKESYKGLNEELSRADTTKERIRVLKETESLLIEANKTHIKSIETLEELNSKLDENSAEYQRNMRSIQSHKMELSELTSVQEKLNIERQTNRWEQYTQAVISANSAIEDFTYSSSDGFMELSDALADFTTEGEISDAVMNDLVESGELLALVHAEDKTAIETLAKQYGLSSEDMYQFQLDLTNKAIELSKTRIVAFNEELSALGKVINEAYDYQNALGAIEDYASASVDLDQELENLEALRKQAENFDTLVSSVDDTTSSVSKLAVEVNEAKDAMKALDDAVDDYSDDFEQSLKDQTREMQKQQDIIDDQIDALEEIAEAEEKAIEKQIDAIEDEIDAVNELYDEKIDNINESIDAIQDEDDAVSDAYSDQIELLEDQIDLLDDQIDAVNELSDDKIEALEDENDLYQDQIDLLNETADIQIEALEDEQELIDAKIESLEAISEAQVEAIEAEQDALQARIDAIEEASEAEDDALTTAEKMLSVQEALANLENVQAERNTRVLGEDGEWSWVANPSDVEDAAKDLQDAQEDLASWQAELEEEKAIALIQAEIDKRDAIIETLETELESQTDALEATRNAIDERIELIEDETEAQEKALDDLIEINDNKIELIQDETEAKIEALATQQELLDTQIEMLQDELEAKQEVYDAEIEALYDTIELLEKEQEVREESLQSDKEALEDKIEILNEELEAEVKLLDAKKELYEDEIDIIDDFLYDLEKIEDDSFVRRLDALKEFVTDWNNQVSRMTYASTVSIDSPDLSTSEADILSAMQANSDAWFSASDTERDELSDANLAMGTSLGLTRDESGTWVDENGIPAYANGGINSSTGIAMLHGTPQEPEMVLNNDQAAGLFNFIKNLPNLNKTPISSGGGTSYNINNLTVQANNPTQFKNELMQAVQFSNN